MAQLAALWVMVVAAVSWAPLVSENFSGSRWAVVYAEFLPDQVKLGVVGCQ